MTNKELIEYFNLSKNIDYSNLGVKIHQYLSSDIPHKVDTIVELIGIVNELDWELYQYNEELQRKPYSELYSSIISAFALNPSLGNVPPELTQLDIKLRREESTEKITLIIDKTFIPLMLNLLLKFNLDKQLLKLLNVILVTRKICLRYHKKVKLTLDADKFRRIRIRYRAEVDYFGFKSSFTEEDLKAAYRRLSLKLHPDRGGDPKEFIKMKQYYDTLSKLFE